MKKFAAVLILFLTSQLIGQTYHTINIDGNNDFNSTNERLLTTSGALAYGYVTWDAEYLYIGYSGNTPSGSLTDGSRLIHIYFDTDPNQTATNGTGTTDGEPGYRWDPVLPFSANYHYIFRTTDNSEVRRVYNGGGWSNAAFTTSNWKGSGYWELKIKLSEIGSPKQINLVSYIEENWEEQFNAKISAGIPAGLFLNTGTQGPITFNSVFQNYYLISEISTNAVYHLTNYQWQIKMNAAAGALNDAAYAGMAKNATNGWDSGIDLPKPPPPASNYVQIHFPHADWLSALGPNYSRDYRAIRSLDSTTEAWDFTVTTDKINSSITLSLPDTSFVPSNYSIKIKDLTNDSLHNFRTLGNYVYNSGANGGNRNFKLIVGISLSSQNIQSNFSSFNFGTVKTNKDSTFNLVLTNTGDSSLVISNVAINGGFYSFTGATQVTLRSNETHTLAVKFAPRASGTFKDTLKITSNDGDTPLLKIPLTGNGQVLTPVIGTSVQSLAFGNVKLTKDSTISFTVSNTGDTALFVNNITSSGSIFAVQSATSFSVPVGGSSTVTVKFTPTAAIAYTDSLKIFNNSVNNTNVNIALSGTGIALVSDLTLTKASLAFGNVSLLADSSQSLYVKNTGETALSVTAIVSSDPAFTVTTSGTFQLNVGDSAITTIKFTPVVPNSYSASVKFISNDPDTAVLTLTGTGVKATVTKSIASGWNLFSISLTPEDSSATAVIGDDIAQFFLYSYSQSGGYFSSQRVIPGSGYWLGIETTASIDVTGIPSADTVTVSLNSGWNLLGTPFTKNYRKGSFFYKRNFGAVSPAAAADSGWIQNAFYGYDKTAGYSSADTLKPWGGYWLAALTDNVKAVYLKASATEESDKNLTPAPAADVNNWAASITAKTGSAEDNLLYFGTSIEAGDGFDAKYDYAKPPISPTANAIQTYFDRNDWNPLFAKYSSDIKAKFEAPAQGKTWSFKFVSKTDGAVVLSWNEILNQIPEAIRNNYNFILTGDGIAAPVNMLTIPSAGFTASSNTVYTFFINANVTGIGDDLLKNLTFDLSQNYPNPFNPSTIIRFSVPENGLVTLKVFDVLGNEVTSLASGYFIAGNYTVNFDASGLTSGVYFYKLTSAGKSITKKLTLTK